MTPRGACADAPPAGSGPSDEHRATLSRRGFLTVAGVGVAAGWMVAGSGGSAMAARTGPVAVAGVPVVAARGSERAALGFLRAAADAYPAVNVGARLAQSYADELGLFSTAFVYDNAVTITALLSADRRVPELARVLGDGLVHATTHDPGFSDGRLRQAYNVGPYTFYDGTAQPYGFVLPDGAANIGWQFGFTGTAVGDMAWPGVALVHLAARTHDQRYLDAAVRLGEWIVARAWRDSGLGGFSFGVNGADAPVVNGSTEHNIDCVAFFTMLARVTRDHRWSEAAAHARAFVDSMWEPSGGYFYTGTNDGVTINAAPLPLDPATWGRLALRERRYDRALDWAATNLAARDDAADAGSQLSDGVVVEGVTFSSASLVSTAQYNGRQVDPRGVWLEGTAQLASAFADRRARGDAQRARGLLDQLRVAQARAGAGQHLGGAALAPGGGVVAASSLLDSGFGFGYFQVQHIGATAWYVLANRAANPLQVTGLD